MALLDLAPTVLPGNVLSSLAMALLPDTHMAAPQPSWTKVTFEIKKKKLFFS